MPDNQNSLQPDPALRRLDRLVGTWAMEGNLVGSDEQNVRGEMTFRWLPGGFLLEQRARIDFIGQQLDVPGADRLRPGDRHLPLDGALRLLADAVAVSVGCPRRPGAETLIAFPAPALDTSGLGMRPGALLPTELEQRC